MSLCYEIKPVTRTLRKSSEFGHCVFHIKQTSLFVKLCVPYHQNHVLVMQVVQCDHTSPSLTLKEPSKIAADDTYFFLLLSFENKA